jgi:PAS domain S-box-containing protein
VLSRLKNVRNAGFPGHAPSAAWLLKPVSLACAAFRKIASRGAGVEANGSGHEQSKAETELLRQFVEQAPVAMAMLDRGMVYVACSQRWIEDFELEGVKVVGRSHYHVFPEIPERWKEAHRKGMAGEVVRAEEDHFERDGGRRLWLRWTVSPWRMADQSIGGITIITEDVTARVLAEKALRAKELRMRLAHEAARGGAWEWRLADDQIRWTESQWSLRELVPSEQWSPIVLTWQTLINPSDYESVIPKALRSVALGEDIEIEWRLKAPESEPVRWYMTRGKPILGANGLPERYFGVVIDITQRKLLEEALRESELRMRMAQEAARVGTWEWRLADNSMQASTPLWKLFGFEKPKEWDPSFDGWMAGIHPADRERIAKTVREATALGREYEIQWRMNLPEGEPERWLLARGRPIANADGRPDRYFGVVIEITERKLAEDALRKSEMRMRLAQEAARAGTWECRPANEINEWSDNLWTLFGLEPGQCEPKIGAWLSTIHPDDRERVKMEVMSAAAAGREVKAQWRVKRPAGEPERWLFARWKRISEEATDHYFGVVIDITDQKLMERAVHESEVRMRLAQEAARAGAWEWRLADNRLEWSDSLWSLYGIEKPEGWEPTTEAWWSLIHPEDRERVSAEVADAVAHGQEIDAPWRLIQPEGEPERWFLARGRPLASANGSPDRYFGVIIDITQQKLADIALRDSAMWMRLAQEAARAELWEWRLEDNSVKVYDTSWRLYGEQQPEAPSIEAWKSIIHPTDRERVITTVMQAAALGQDYEVHWRLNLPEGQPERWFLDRGKPLANGKERPERYIGAAIDISEQKRMEKALRESEGRQSFLLSINDALRAVDEPVEAIAIAAKMLGRKLNANQVVYDKANEIIHQWNDGSMSAFAVLRPDHFDEFIVEDLTSGRTVVVGDVGSDLRMCTPEGRAIFEQNSVAAFIAVPFVKNDRQAGLLAVHKRDPHQWSKDEIALAQEVAERTWEVAERARVSLALRESQDRLNFALAAGEAGTWELSLASGEIEASVKARALINVPLGTPLTLESLLAHVHPEDRPLIPEALRRTVETGESHPLEWRTQLADGSIRWLETRGEPRTVFGKQHVVGLIQDVTRKVQQKEAVQRAAKRESEFLSSMSHELRTPMHAILGYTDICKSAVKEGKTEGVEKYLNNVATSGKRLLHLLNDLLDLAKMEEGRMEYRFERSDVKDVVDHALMELDPLIKAKNLEMRVSLGERTDAFIDRNHIIQVLINLLSNAIKFSNPGSRIGIEVCEEQLCGGERGIRCRVIDDGPGIPEDELKAVFDKFVQSKKTKSGKGGTGLGLAICDHIVKAHGGRIWAENAKPGGAAFTFVLRDAMEPRASAPPERLL